MKIKLPSGDVEMTRRETKYGDPKNEMITAVALLKKYGVTTQDSTGLYCIISMSSKERDELLQAGYKDMVEVWDAQQPVRMYGAAVIEVTVGIDVWYMGHIEGTEPYWLWAYSVEDNGNIDTGWCSGQEIGGGGEFATRELALADARQTVEKEFGVRVSVNWNK